MAIITSIFTQSDSLKMKDIESTSMNSVDASLEFMIRKSNQLLKSRFDFNLWEMRIFERMLTYISTADEDFKFERVYIKDLLRFYNAKHNNYDLVRKASLSLIKKSITIYYRDDENKARVAHLNVMSGGTLPYYEDSDGEAYVEFKLNQDLKPHLLGLKECFKKYDSRNFVSLKKTYSFRFYFLLKQYELLGTRKMELAEIRNLFCIEEGQYSKYADFKRRVLVPAQKELQENCDISFEFEEIRRGRKVRTIKFTVIPNEPKWGSKAKPTRKVKDITPPKVAGNEAVEKIYQKVITWNVSRDTIEKYLAKYPENHVMKAVAYVEQQLKEGNKIDNIGGYLNKMVSVKEIVDKNEVRKEELDSKKKQLKEKSKHLEQIEKDINLLTEKCKKADDKIIYEKTAIVRGALDKVTNEKPILKMIEENPIAEGKYDKSLSLKENYEEAVTRMFVTLFFERNYPSLFEPIASLKDEYNVLKEEINVQKKKRESLKTDVNRLKTAISRLKT